MDPALSVAIWATCGVAALTLIAFEVRRWRRDERERREWEEEIRRAFAEEQTVVWLNTGEHFTAGDLRERREKATWQ